MTVLLEENLIWLEQKAREVIKAVHFVTLKGLHCWMPAIGGYRESCWLRDFAYMLMYGPTDAFDWNEVSHTLEQFIILQAHDGAVPDFIQVKSGKKAISPIPSFAVIGAHTCEDNPMFLIQAVNRVCEVIKDNSLFRKYIESFEKGLSSVSLCPASGLVFIDPLTPHSGYGFCDVVDKRGHDLFCSLLWWESATILARKCKEAGQIDKSLNWQKKADWVHQHIIPAFWDANEGLLLAATVRNKQPDIWGSAYAVAIGAVDDSYADRIAESLLSNYDRVVRNGQIRHTLSAAWMHILHECSDYRYSPIGNPLKQVEPGTYQNGGFWATPTGWFAIAIARKDKNKAGKLINDCTEYFKDNDIYECIDVNETTGHEGRGRIAGYAASVTNTLIAKKILY